MIGKEVAEVILLTIPQLLGTNCLPEKNRKRRCRDSFVALTQIFWKGCPLKRALKLAGLVTDSFFFSWLHTIKDQLKKCGFFNTRTIRFVSVGKSWDLGKTRIARETFPETPEVMAHIYLL